MSVNINASLTDEDGRILTELKTEYTIGTSDALRMVFKHAKANSNLRLKDKEISLLKSIIEALEANDTEAIAYQKDQLKALYREEIESVL